MNRDQDDSWDSKTNYAVVSPASASQDTGECSQATTTDHTTGTIVTAQYCSEEGDGQPLVPVYALTAPDHEVYCQISPMSTHDVSPLGFLGELPSIAGIFPMDADTRYATHWEYSRSDTTSDTDYVSYRKEKEMLIMEQSPVDIKIDSDVKSGPDLKIGIDVEIDSDVKIGIDLEINSDLKIYSDVKIGSDPPIEATMVPVSSFKKLDVTVGCTHLQFN